MRDYNIEFHHPIMYEFFLVGFVFETKCFYEYVEVNTVKILYFGLLDKFLMIQLPNVKLAVNKIFLLGVFDQKVVLMGEVVIF